MLGDHGLGDHRLEAKAAPLGIVCGGGGLPVQVAEAAVRSGRKVFLLGIEGNAGRGIEKFPHAWFHVGQIRRPRSLLREAGCRELCIIGYLVRPALTALRLDRESLRLLPRVVQLYRGGDDRLLSGVAALVEHSLDMRIVGVNEVAPTLLAPDGPFGRHTPSPDDQADIALGLDVLAALGPFDIGQAVIVARRQVLAVEASEGTDGMLERVAGLRAKGAISIPAGAGVLVKAPKPQQDVRLDMPTIGPRTVANVTAAGLAGVAVVAGSVIVADADLVVAAADQSKVFVFGVPAMGGG
jgi:DUF1009 family protein